MRVVVSSIHHITIMFAPPSCFSSLAAGSLLHVTALHVIAPVNTAPTNGCPDKHWFPVVPYDA